MVVCRIKFVVFSRIGIAQPSSNNFDELKATPAQQSTFCKPKKWIPAGNRTVLAPEARDEASRKHCQQRRPGAEQSNRTLLTRRVQTKHQPSKNPLHG